MEIMMAKNRVNQRTGTLTNAQCDDIAQRIAERVKDMWLCGAFDDHMNLIELATEIRQDLPIRGKKGK
jgi:hypothetical protein